MKNLFYKSFVVLFILLFNLHLCAKEPDVVLSASKSESKIISFNIASKQVLEIHVPSDFKAGEVSRDEVLELYEFVPKEDSFEHWNRIISVQKTSSPVCAYAWSYMSKDIGPTGEKPLLSTYNTGLEKGRKIATLVFDRPGLILGNGKSVKSNLNEITIQKFIEGIDHTFVLEYSVRYDPKVTSEKEKEQILKSSKEFIDFHFHLSSRD